MNFASDNVRGCAPQILRAVVDGLSGAVPSYGGDDLSLALEARLAEIFEIDLAVAPVATGSAANGLALSLITPPWASVVCHADAHIMRSEAGGPQFFTGGARLVGVPGADGKLAPGAVAEAIARLNDEGLGAAPPASLSLTQITEQGTAYRPEQIAELSALARAHGMAVHMDGARLANALASLDVSPAEMTWRAGVDVLSFGATKNGCIAAEAVILFNPTPDRRRELASRRLRAGQLFSKHRFMALQLTAYLADGLWLDLARHANGQARRLAAGLDGVGGTRIVGAVDGNQVFIAPPDAILAAWRAAGVGFSDWDPGVVRMVCAFDADPADVDRVIAVAREAAGRISA